MAIASSSSVPGQKNDFLKVDKHPKRFAYCPAFVTLDGFAALDPNFQRELLMAVDDNKAEKTAEGYLYPEIAFADTSYIDKKGYYIYDPAWGLDFPDKLDENGKKRSTRPTTRFCAPVIQYHTDNDGEVITLPESKQPLLSDGTRVPFNYDILYLTMSQTQFSTWRKLWTKEFNPVATDFLVSRDEAKNNSPWVFSTSRVCLWRNHGPALINQILRDGRPYIAKAQEKVGRKVDLDTFKEDVLGITHVTPPSQEEVKRYGQFMGGQA